MAIFSAGSKPSSRHALMTPRATMSTRVLETIDIITAIRSTPGFESTSLARPQAFATDGLAPHLTILIDVPVEVGLGRKRRGLWNRFEDTEGAAFFEAVRAAYLRLAAADPDRFRVVDGSGRVPEVDEAIQALIEPLLAYSAP